MPFAESWNSGPLAVVDARSPGTSTTESRTSWIYHEVSLLPQRRGRRSDLCDRVLLSIFEPGQSIYILNEICHPNITIVDLAESGLELRDLLSVSVDAATPALRKKLYRIPEPFGGDSQFMNGLSIIVVIDVLGTREQLVQ